MRVCRCHRPGHAYPPGFTAHSAFRWTFCKPATQIVIPILIACDAETPRLGFAARRLLQQATCAPVSSSGSSCTRDACPNGTSDRCSTTRLADAPKSTGTGATLTSVWHCPWPFLDLLTSSITPFYLGMQALPVVIVWISCCNSQLCCHIHIVARQITLCCARPRPLVPLSHS